MISHRIVLIKGDGHCLFRSIYFGFKEKEASSENIYKMRRAACNYIGKRWQKYQPFLIDYENFNDYETKMMRNAWGGEPEIRALAKIMNCTISIYDTRFKKWVNFRQKNPIKKIYLRYSGGTHYDCILKINSSL